ncbi:MAG: outer membrane protein assembly factor BamE [Alphaproteobacteria bacterium]|nr:outer membrane protein assembly factor BamE [Alphaproteobacteria bacterium]
MPRLALFLIAAALAAPFIPVRGAQIPAEEPLTLNGQCVSSDESGACTVCAVLLKEDLDGAIGSRAVTGSCPQMAAGRYRLDIAVPIRLVPTPPHARIFAQLRASLGVTSSRGVNGGDSKVLPQPHPVEWSWWGAAGFAIEQTAPVTLDRAAVIHIALSIDQVRYYVPRRTQGPPRYDGELIMQQGQLMRMERLPPPVSAQAVEAPREFSAKTLAEIAPGHTTKQQIEALLGTPWRTVEVDEDDAQPEAWEYRGKAAGGAYQLHIEFDDHGTVSAVARLPEKTGTAAPQIAKAPPQSSKP